MDDSNLLQLGTPLATPFPAVRPLPAAIAQARTLVMAAVVSIALGIRLFGLGAASFSEDEINKIRAIEAYDRGDFSANAEHPMLMKLAMWTSVHATERLGIAPETALRLPNAIAGAATAGAIFLVAEILFDTTVGGWAALLWAIDINAASINRIGKEDSFLLLFLLLAVYFYERAKEQPLAARERHRWFLRSAVAFGLMMASKYMPYYFGLHVLFNVAGGCRKRVGQPQDKQWWFYAAMAVAFLAANAAVLLPATWRYLAWYIHGDSVRHTGYLFAHRLYLNTIDATPFGAPPYFYLAFFATKVPLVVLAAAVAGLVWAFRHASHRGATFVRVFLVFTLLPYSLVAGKFLRYVLPTLAVVDIAAALGVVWALGRIGDVRAAGRRTLLTAGCAAALVLPAAAQWASVAPYYGLAQNVVGASLGPRGWMFPDDELYDAGVREAVAEIAAVASPGAVVCSDAAEVVQEYLARGGRRDMRSCSISHDGLPMQPVQTWMIVQNGHTYFENAAVIELVRGRSAPWRDVQVAGVPAATVYRIK